MVYMILKRTRGPDPPPWSISNSYNKTYNSYIRPSVTLPVLAQWFLSSSSTHCDTHILPTSSFATLNLSFVIYLKFSLPIMHKLSVISNHIFLCRQNPVFTSKTGVSFLDNFCSSLLLVMGGCLFLQVPSSSNRLTQLWIFHWYHLYVYSVNVSFLLKKMFKPLRMICIAPFLKKRPPMIFLYQRNMTSAIVQIVG